MTRKKLFVLLPLLLLAGNLAGQTSYTENTEGQFTAGSHNATYASGSTVELDYYGRTSGLASPGDDVWFNPGWSYRLPLEIGSNNPGALLDYPAVITVDTQDAISSGRMKADGSDIRFTTAAAAGIALSIPYYIESGLNTAATRIWVRHPKVSQGTNPVYLYSGNASASAASSLTGTFVMGDYFTAPDGSSPSTSTWSGIQSAAPAAGSLRDIQSGRLRFLFGSPLGTRYYGLRSASPYAFAAGRSYSAEVVARASGDSWSSFALCPSIYTYSYDQDDWLRLAVHHTASGASYHLERSDYGSKSTLTSGAISAGTHEVNFIITASSVTVLLDGTEIYSAANTLSFNSPYLYLEASSSGAALEEFVFDKVAVRPYSAPEPYMGSVGGGQGRRFQAGNFLSQTHDSGADGTLYSQADWLDSVPQDSSVTLQLRAHNSDIELATFTQVSNGGSPDIYGRYAQYRLGFATLDPRYTASVASVTLSYISPPLAPVAPHGHAQSQNSIKWLWTDNSSGQYQEEGFSVFDSSGVLKGSVGSDVPEWTETGLNPNTPYSRAIAGHNSSGTGQSAAVMRYTLPVEPDVSCDKSTGTWLAAAINCNNSAGFGPNGVAYYRYAWTQQPTQAWSGAETPWSSGSMSKSDFFTGNYYLHVKSHNGDDIALPDYRTYGPYWYDKNAPSVSGFSPSSSPWTNSGFSVLVSFADDGGSKLHRARYRWTTSPDRPATGWQAWDYSVSDQDNGADSFAIGSAGQWYLHTEVEDTAGNTGYSNSGVYRIDLTKPSGSVVINSGDTHTPSADVVLSLSYSDSESGVRELSYRNLGGAESAPELPQPTTTWTLSPGDGSKQVYFKVTDNAGNTQQYADTIILDSRTSLLGSAVNGTASGVMGEPPESFQARARLSWTPDGSQLQGKTLSFYFDGSTQTAVTDILGYASAAFETPAATGTYVYGVSFESDGTYSQSSSTGTLTAAQRATSLITEDVNANSGAEFTARATLKDFYTELPIAGATVSFYFEGSTLTAVTNASGLATTVFTAPIEVDFYDYTASYAGGPVYGPRFASSRVGVGLRVTSLSVPAASALAQAGFTAQATLMDGGVPVEGAVINFYFQGSTETAATDASGLASYSFTAPASSGTYPFSAAFGGDGTYAASSGGALLTVNRRPLSLAGEMGQGYVDASVLARAVLYDGITAQRVPGKS
ncbi:MAG: DUF2341 domain-containing protein, partial [Elusimicrobiales bacterium]|nr:DUF2341 domain-containing protein [Elusimicrobiales bacterium]